MSEALISDIGLLRDKNQDYITKAINTNNDILYILCDGMGGYKGGEVASCKSASILKKYFEKTTFVDANEAKEWLTNTIEQVNAEIKDLATHNSELSKMGTTLICLLITKDYKMFASVGDSRLYSYSKKELKQISEDQTFVNALLKAGYIDKKEAEIHPNKSVLVSAIGGSSECEMEIQVAPVQGDNFLLCSDGLYNMVSDEQMLTVLQSEDDLESKASKLVDLANNQGGRDNISIILVEVAA